MSVRLIRLVKRADFVRAAKSGRKCVTHSIVLQVVKSSHAADGVARVGFTATKKLGNAVVRNRAKRRMRAVADAVLAERGQAGMDYVLIARDLCVQAPYDTLLRDLAYALNRIKG